MKVDGVAERRQARQCRPAGVAQAEQLGRLVEGFARLKTAVRTQVLKLGSNVCEQDKANLAASTQQAIVDVLVRKSIQALRDTGLKRIVVAGGVGANALLREQLNHECAKRQIRVHYPELALCTDNGAMIALAAMRLQRDGAVERLRVQRAATLAVAATVPTLR